MAEQTVLVPPTKTSMHEQDRQPGSLLKWFSFLGTLCPQIAYDEATVLELPSHHSSSWILLFFLACPLCASFPSFQPGPSAPSSFYPSCPLCVLHLIDT